MTTVSVTSTFTDPSGIPVPNAVVVATLVGPTILSSSSVERQVITYTDNSGIWNLNLTPNTAFSSDPSQSWYVVKVGNKEEYRIRVTTLSGNGHLDTSNFIIGDTISHADATFFGNITMGGNVVINGNLTLTGTLTCPTIIYIPASQLASLNSNTTFFYGLKVYGDVTITGSLICSAVVQLTDSGNSGGGGSVNIL